MALLIAIIPSFAFADSSVDAPTTVTTARKAYNKIQIKWDKVSGADGYAVYKATSENGKYSLIKRIDSGKTTSYTWGKATTGTTYYFKVKAYDKVGTKRVYGSYSEPTKGKAYLSKPVTYRNDGEYLRFSKVTGATGYDIYRSTDPNTGYKKVKTATSKNLEYTYYYKAKKKTYACYIDDKNYKDETVFYYKVKAYRKVNGKKVYSSFSDYDIFYNGVPSKKPWTKITYLEQEGKKVFELVNKARKEAGYPELEWDEEMYKYAQARVKNCCHAYYKDGFLSHNAVGDYIDGLEELGIGNGAGENAALGYCRGQDAFQAWMNSTGHKKLFFDYYDHNDPANSAACAIGIDKKGKVFGIFIVKYDEWFVKEFEYFK